MKLRSLTICAALPMLAAVVNAPALAQPSTAQQLDAAVSACLVANQDKANPPQDDITACEPGIARIEEIYAATAAPTPHDTNLLHMYRAFVHTAIGGAYGQIDGVRSSRVCTQTEASWTELSQLVDANSPANLVASFNAMRQSAISPITKCRASKGTPPGAAPLPG